MKPHQRMPASSSCMQTADLMVHGSPAKPRPECHPMQGCKNDDCNCCMGQHHKDYGLKGSWE